MEERLFVVGIIGNGDFGGLVSLVCKLFFPKVEVRMFSRRAVPDGKVFFSLEDTCKSDVVFITVPIRHFEQTVQNIVDFVGAETILVDVCTVKIHPANVFQKYASHLNYICTHPMFGPYSFAKINNRLDGLRIVLTEHNLSAETYDFIKQLLIDLKLVVVEKTSDQHDKQLAETLCLTHLIGQIVHVGGFERTDIDTLSFGFLMDAVESVRQDEDLFRDVYTYNPYCLPVLEKFHAATDKVVDILEA